MSFESDFTEETVDPRVQIELERLNATTNEINKAEISLDECRNQFRALLSESTQRIDNLAKKLGGCIEKARPYYDARIAAKLALRETQKAAARYERANSAHAAAKEMVYLAEEGLKAEGRTFDHAWQEMLNHATMRVNESEAERTAMEAEHNAHLNAVSKLKLEVQIKEKELKRVIAKSRPYFELKIYYNQLLEEQKNKVKALEKQVAETKFKYAETLRNLEQISDEIHRTRQYKRDKTGVHAADCKSNNESVPTKAVTSSGTKEDLIVSVKETKITPTSNSSFDISEVVIEPENNNSSLTTSPETESDNNVLEEFIQKSNIPNIEEGYGICSFPVNAEFNEKFNEPSKSEWTEIKLHSPEQNEFPKMSKCKENFDIPYSPLADAESPTNQKSLKAEDDSEWVMKSNHKEETSDSPKRTYLRRQSLDVLWSHATGEKVKEILSSGILKFNIGSGNELRNNESIKDDQESNVKEAKEANLPNQFGLQFFSKKGKTEETEVPKPRERQDSITQQIGELISRKDKIFGKKMPSPFDRTLGFLNVDDESNSDNDSMPSIEMLTDEQLSALVLDQDLSELYQDIVS